MMIKVENLTLNFDGKIIFNNFNLKINSGEKAALIGESGSGKSSLLNLLVGFIPNYSGKVFINGNHLSAENIKEIRKNIAFLPQDIYLKENTVKGLLLKPFEFSTNKKNKPEKDEISKLLSEFEIEENLLNKKINEISGGQKQRILLAGCLLLKKPILITDEPTSALDEGLKRKITDYIMQQNELTVIAATHDEYWIKNSDKVIELTPIIHK